jgi:hypothetical protein
MDRSRRTGLIGCTLLGLTLLSLWGYQFRDRILTGENDFLQLYAGARLAGTPQLYDIPANQRIQLEARHIHVESVYYTRLPFYAWLLSPLGHLPYLQAYAVFQLLSLTLFGAFVFQFARRYPETLVLVSMSAPVFVTFANGQDAAGVAAMAGLAYLLAEKNRDFAAGLLLSLCAIKFHLLVLLPIALIAQKRWRILGGGAAGGAVWLAASFATGGLDWPRRYLDLLSNPILHPSPELMPSFHNVADAFHLGLPLEIGLGLLVAALVGWAAHRSNFATAYGLALAAGPLVCHHSYTHDLTLLIPAAAIFVIGDAPKILRSLAFLAALPPVCFLALVGRPSSFAITGFLCALVIAATWAVKPERAVLKLRPV